MIDQSTFTVGKAIISIDFGTGVVVDTRIDGFDERAYITVMFDKTKAKSFISVTDNLGIRRISAKEDLLSDLEELIHEANMPDFSNKKDRIDYFNKKSKIEEVPVILETITEIDDCDEISVREKQLRKKLFDSIVQEYSIVFEESIEISEDIVRNYIEGELK